MAGNENEKSLKDSLKFELGFVELGGYYPSVREPRGEAVIFRESPSCLNYGSEVRTHPCSECFLIDFVPSEKRGESVPCHFIPLNERGDTVATLAGSGDAFKVQDALRAWLHKTIDELDAAPAAAAAKP